MFHSIGVWKKWRGPVSRRVGWLMGVLEMWERELRKIGDRGYQPGHRGLDTLPHIQRRELTPVYSLARAAFKTCTTTGFLPIFGIMHCNYVLSDVRVQESDIFRIASAFSFISQFLAVDSYPLRNQEDVAEFSSIRGMLVLSISEWSENWQTDKRLESDLPSTNRARQPK